MQMGTEPMPVIRARTAPLSDRQKHPASAGLANPTVSALIQSSAISSLLVVPCPRTTPSAGALPYQLRGEPQRPTRALQLWRRGS